MTAPDSGVRYDVFSPAGAPPGGKRVAVFPDAAGDLQARAAAAGTPLSVFIEEAEMTGVKLRIFTPSKEKGESDSASVAALFHLQGRVLDVTEVRSGDNSTLAQPCSGDWLLQQGVVQVQDAGQVTFSNARAAHIAGTARPNLLLEVTDLAALDSFTADAEAISELGRQTGTTGLVLYTLQAPAEGPQRRADVCFRAFGPLKGFLEDAASSNMFACLTGVLRRRGLLPEGGNLIRGGQRMPGQPALLTAQFGTAQEAVWVGGKATVSGV